MVCKNCGSEVAQGASQCHVCGARIDVNSGGFQSNGFGQNNGFGQQNGFYDQNNGFGTQQNGFNNQPNYEANQNNFQVEPLVLILLTPMDLIRTGTIRNLIRDRDLISL